MPTFEYAFTIPAPLEEVIAFHQDTRVIKKLMPPPVLVQVHHADALEEGAVSELTLWIGPAPVRWRAMHYDVDGSGFKDVQVRGPLDRWEHTHRFMRVDENRTRISERVEYRHRRGPQGVATRLLFNRPLLTLLFTYRRAVTRLALRRSPLPKRDYLPVIAAGLFVWLFLLFRWRRETDRG